MATFEGVPVLPSADGPLGVPPVSEGHMWAAELAYLPDDNAPLRHAQFAIRTAVRAQELARMAGTLAVDELLDARAKAVTPAALRVYETAITYLNREQELHRDCWWPVHG